MSYGRAGEAGSGWGPAEGTEEGAEGVGMEGVMDDVLRVRKCLRR